MGKSRSWLRRFRVCRCHATMRCTGGEPPQTLPLRRAPGRRRKVRRQALAQIRNEHIGRQHPSVKRLSSDVGLGLRPARRTRSRWTLGAPSWPRRGPSLPARLRRHDRCARVVTARRRATGCVCGAESRCRSCCRTHFGGLVRPAWNPRRVDATPENVANRETQGRIGGPSWGSSPFGPAGSTARGSRLARTVAGARTPVRSGRVARLGWRAARVSGGDGSTPKSPSSVGEAWTSCQVLCHDRRDPTGRGGSRRDPSRRKGA